MKNYAVFDKMSTEELKKILLRDSFTDESTDPDRTLYILRELARREDADPACEKPDINAAFAGFQSLYLPFQSPLSLYEEEPDEAAPDLPASRPPKPARRRRFLRSALAAAAILALAVGGLFTAEALNVDFFENVVSWTKDFFTLSAPKDPNATVHFITDELRAAMQEHDVWDVMPPTYFPDGYEQYALNITETRDRYIFSCDYTSKDGGITLLFQQDLTPDAPFYDIYDDGSEAEIYEYAGVSFRIRKNPLGYIAVWRFKNIHGTISGVNTKNELIKMINSVEIQDVSDQTAPSVLYSESEFITDRLHAVLKNHGITEVSPPTCFPAGYKQSELDVYQYVDEYTISSSYENGENLILIKFLKSPDPNASLGNISKDDGDPEIYSNRNVDFYIMTNCGNYLAVWRYGNVQGGIFNVETKSELIKMINSMEIQI